MKKLFISALLFFSASYIAQKQKSEKISLAEEIRKNFQYDSLSSLSCMNTPPGVYAIKFKITKKGESQNFQSTNDSLFYLNHFNNSGPSPAGAGYAGHVDLILNGNCIGGANATPTGGVKSIRVWVLN